MSIIRKFEEQPVIERPQPQNGPGVMITRNLIPGGDADLWGKGRLFAINTLNKDCGVGWHMHEGDGEIYYILEGEAEYNDNGTVTTLKKGDVSFTFPGEGHSITNLKDEPMTFMAMIIYE